MLILSIDNEHIAVMDEWGFVDVYINMNEYTKEPAQDQTSISLEEVRVRLFLEVSGTLLRLRFPPQLLTSILLLSAPSL